MKRFCNYLIASITLLIGLMAACKTPPPVTMQGPEAAAVALVVSGEKDCTVAYFVAVDPKTKSVQSSSVISSTYNVDERIYWMNAKPGSYALIGCTRVEPAGQGTVVRFHFLLSEETAKAAIFEVRPGGLTVLGSIKLAAAQNDKEADPLQNHYRQILCPTARKITWSQIAGVVADVLKSMFSGQAAQADVYLLSSAPPLSQAAATATVLRQKVATDWEGSDWSKLLRR